MRIGQIGQSLDGDPEPILFHLSMIFVMLLLHGFFVGAEIAILRARSGQIHALALEGNAKAKFADSLATNLNAYLFACQLGITLTSLGLGWLGEPTISKLIEPLLHRLEVPDQAIHTIAFVIGFTVIVAVHVTIGKQLPKTFAIRKPEQVTIWSAGPILLFYRITYPLFWWLKRTSNWILRKSGIEPGTEYESVPTEEEIRTLVKESNENGYIDQTKHLLFDNVFDFSKTVAREIMIPRTEVNCLYADLSFEENLQIAMSQMHTRYPLCDPDKDHIIGYVHIKDLLKAVRSEISDIRTIARPLMTIPETMLISTLMKKMQTKRTEVALLIDEYGGTYGFITMEDILEELVGEIHDEFDQEQSNIVWIDEQSCSVDGLLHLDEFSAYFNLDIQSEDYHTIGGWVYSQLETLPAENHRFVYSGCEFIVDGIDQRRISRIIVKKLQVENDALTDVS